MAQKIYMTTPFRIFVITAIMAVTLLYGRYQNSFISQYIESDQSESVLEHLPAFNAKLLGEEREVNPAYYQAKGTDYFVVHFWGTWCAPCEAEFPEIVKLAGQFKDSKRIKFLFIATRDNENDVKKFMRRFSNLSPNIDILIDLEGKAMLDFGTVKVPETYVFGMNNKLLKKFTGPQNWENTYYFNYLQKLFN